MDNDLHKDTLGGNMAIKIDKPSIIEAAGNKPKIIEEYVGNVNTNTKEVSIAKMKSPKGWVEPGQTPEFTEYTVVLKGTLNIQTKEDLFVIKEGEAFISFPSEWVQYSTPLDGGAEYIAVCLPGFTIDSVKRDC